VWDERETVGIDAARGRDFDAWVRRRLADWPTARILELERWLLEQGEIEFVRAVRGAVSHRESAA
jgi:hypothetical protein